MKFSEDFCLCGGDGSRFLFESGGKYSFCIDFLGEKLLRVAQTERGVQPLNTYFVCPEGCEMPLKGRPRLSLEGFSRVFPQTREEKGRMYFFAGGFTAELELHNFHLSLFTPDLRPLAEDVKTQSYNLGGELGRGLTHRTVRHRNDMFFGLGDKSGNVNKAGRRYEIYCLDAMGYDAETADPLYKHIPFYIAGTDNGYVGIFYDTAAKSAVDLGAQYDNYHGLYSRFDTEDDALCYYVMFGTLPEIVSAFSRLCGEQLMPPKRFLKYSGSAMGYAEAPDAQRQLEGFIDRCREYGFDCGGFHLSSGYTTVGEKRCVFEWNTEKIPEPKRFTEKYRENEIGILANIKPAFLTGHPQYEQISRRGLFLKNPDGTSALCQFWDGLGSYLDFSNPAGYEFWVQSVKKALIDYGIDYTWNDNNEFEVWDESVLADNFGSPVPACRIRPTLTMLMLMASREAFCRYVGGRFFLSTRSGGAGLWRYGQTWSGDNRTEWKTLRYNHRMGVGMSLSGMFDFGHDIGGFEGQKPSRELFLRWVQHGVFMPRFTIHSWHEDGSVNEPWMFPDAVEAVRGLFALRKRLMPYLYNAFWLSRQCAEPIVTPLFYRFDYADVESDLYMLGRDILVCNVFDEGAVQAEALLPAECGWYFGEEYHAGGEYVVKDSVAEGLPVFFVRAGCVVPEDVSEYGFAKEQNETVFHIYAAESGSSESSFFDDDGEGYGYFENDCTRLFISLRCEKDAVYVSFENRGKRPVSPRFVLTDAWGRQLRVMKNKE